MNGNESTRLLGIPLENLQSVKEGLKILVEAAVLGGHQTLANKLLDSIALAQMEIDRRRGYYRG